MCLETFYLEELDGEATLALPQAHDDAYLNVFTIRVPLTYLR